MTRTLMTAFALLVVAACSDMSTQPDLLTPDEASLARGGTAGAPAVTGSGVAVYPELGARNFTLNVHGTGTDATGRMHLHTQGGFLASVEVTCATVVDNGAWIGGRMVNTNSDGPAWQPGSPVATYVEDNGRQGDEIYYLTTILGFTDFDLDVCANPRLLWADLAFPVEGQITVRN